MNIVIGDGVVKWVGLKTGTTFGEARGIGLMRDGKIVSGIAYAEFNGKNVFTHQAHEVPLTRRYLWTIFDFPFNQLKCERLTGVIPSCNEKARKLTEHYGFRLETVLKDAHPDGDLLYYVMWKKDCRWINENLYKVRLPMAA